MEPNMNEKNDDDKLAVQSLYNYEPQFKNVVPDEPIIYFKYLSIRW